MRCHLPRARAEAVRRGDQGPDRAQVYDIARHLVMNGLLDVRTNLHLFAAADHSELLVARDLLRKADAARAACHIRRDQRAEILVLDRAFALVEARDVTAESNCEILQLALTALVAD